MTSEEIKVTIIGGPPFGMRIKGGSEFGQPIILENVSQNGKAWNAGARVGDFLSSINGVDVSVSKHDDAKTLILNAKQQLELVLRRGGPFTSSSTSQPVTLPTEPTKTPSPAPAATPTSFVSQSQQTTGPSQASSQPTTKSPVTAQAAPKSSPSVPNTTTASQSSASPEPPRSFGGGGLGNIVGSRDPVKYERYDPDAPESKAALIGSVLKCQQCQQAIGTDRHVKLGERVWHQDHFNCSSCNKSLAAQGFYEEQNKIFCKECYADSVSPKCHICSKSCSTRYVTAQNRAYHSECFNCANCKKSLSGLPFNFQNDFPHCMDCINDILSIKCEGCMKAIKPGQEFLEAGNKQYHAGCFRCAICDKDLSVSGRFVLKDGKHCCPGHI